METYIIPEIKRENPQNRFLKEYIVQGEGNYNMKRFRS